MAAQQPQRGGSQITLYALAGLLGAVGIGFLVAALFALGDDGPSVRSDVTLPEATATAVSGVAGVQSTQPPAETATIVVVPTQPATPEPEATVPATEPPAATATLVPADTPVPVATSPPAPQPTAESTETQTEEPTATPSGPRLTISGPTAVAVGEPAQFGATVNPEPLKVVWSYLGQETAHARNIAVTFPSDGCFTVALAAIYSDGSTVTTVLQVAAGNGSCP